MLILSWVRLEVSRSMENFFRSLLRLSVLDLQFMWFKIVAEKNPRFTMRDPQAYEKLVLRKVQILMDGCQKKKFLR
ncbi:hypothetical protein O164_06180 [Pseudomonas taiwanensis SJ9]|uniref:Uncharacterized protein n=1 Tax=Pseudomonas taiwanensis SJ9 TaxID=1388762 RepID=V7DDN2_9PSED|nr:hypothetical protein O164_06180 [Pseudomonas taiwanensis SJ9]